MRQPKLIELLDDLAIASNMADMADDPGTRRLLIFQLRRAQNFIYWNTDWRQLVASFPLTTVVTNGVGQRFYDYPTIEQTIDGDTITDTLEPQRILEVTLQRGTARFRVECGIDPLLYTTTTQMPPYRFEPRQQIELYPAPDAAYTVHFQGCIALRRFQDDDDRATCHGDIVLELAAAAVKAGWGQADASAYGQQAAALLRKRNAKNHSTQRYIPGVAVATPTSPLSPSNIAPWPEPTLVGNWSDL